MIFVDLKEVTLGFGGTPLLENISLQIHENEKVALIGRNGQGKSTLLKLIEGRILPDKGEIQRSQGARVTYLVQEVPQNLVGSTFDIVVQGLGEVGKAIIEYNKITHQLEKSSDDKWTEKLSQVQAKLDQTGGWEEIQSVEEIISRLSLEPEDRFETLSAGKKRRVLLAQTLVKKPDLLLLDEPTNHLDIPSIQWLEDFFTRYEGSILFITHDRSFLRKLATRIIELDRGHLSNWECSYEKYLERKEAFLQAEEKQHKKFDRELAQEEVWIRTGVQARRTRNEGRVRRLKKMRDEHRQRRKKMGSVKIIAQNAERSGNLILHAENIVFSYSPEEKPIIDNFSTTIMRGSRVGIIGPNGCGKTTLLKILLGELPFSQGELKLGTNIQIAYFDQLRNKLDRNKSVFDNIGEGNDVVMINGQKKHVMGYLQDFLFSPRDVNNPVRTLSGGEQNRLLLAKLFLQPSNILVLDEPTNDLDTDTLELLEELVIDYSGTVFLVSHDRAFLNNVVTSSIVFDNGKIEEYFGGYDDWLRQRPKEVKKPKKETVIIKKERKKNISFREKKELEELPLKIEEWEEEQQKLYEEIAAPEFYQQKQEDTLKTQKRLEQILIDLETAYARWEELEELAEG